MMRVDPFNILIVSDEAAFSRAITNRWQLETVVPAFTTLGSALQAGSSADSFDLTIVGGIPSTSLASVLRLLVASGHAVIAVVDDQAATVQLSGEFPRASLLCRDEGWADLLLLLAKETLLRVDALRRLEEAEAARRTLEREATLGRYMLEMRHTLNNALTAVLGNSELLLIEPGTLSATSIAQVETIRNHSLRIHEVLQRFSSLEKEMMFVERQALHRTAAACD